MLFLVHFCPWTGTYRSIFFHMNIEDISQQNYLTSETREIEAACTDSQPL